MASPEVIADITARLAAGAVIAADHISWPNEIFDVPAVDDLSPLWLAIETIGRSAQPMETASRIWQEDGTAYFHGFAPAGAGAADLRQLLKDVALLFRGSTPGAIIYPSMEIGFGAATDDGNWYRMTLTIDYRFFDEMP